MKKIIGFAKNFAVSPFMLRLAFLPAGGSAANQPDITGGGANVPYATALTSTQGVLDFVCLVFSWMFYFLIVLAVIFIVIGAYKYLTSSGDSEKVKGATNTLLYAAIAVAVALLAKAIPSIVASFLGLSGPAFIAC